MSLLVACLLITSLVIIIYFGLLSFTRILYRNNPVICAAFGILISPFILVITQARDLVELSWILLLTPFYGIVVLLSLFTNWMIVYYNIAFGILAALRSLTIVKRQNVSLKRTVRSLAFVIILADILVLSPLLLEADGVRNPNYQEVLQFVVSDRTNQNQYREQVYTCANFAEDFRNNALNRGYACGYVVIYFPDGGTHAINCFNTTDQGIVFIEPQTDAVVTLTRGRPYLDRTEYEPQKYNDTVIGYTITWHSSSGANAYSRLLAVLSAWFFSSYKLPQLFNYYFSYTTLSVSHALNKRLISRNQHGELVDETAISTEQLKERLIGEWKSNLQKWSP